MLSPCLEGEAESIILHGIRVKNVAVVRGALKAGKLRVAHLGSICDARVFSNLYDELDSVFGLADLANLTFASEGRALCYLVGLLYNGTRRVKATALELLGEASGLTNMALLDRLYRLHALCITESGALRALCMPLNGLFVMNLARWLSIPRMVYQSVLEAKR
jgi:hypothetical protein